MPPITWDTASLPQRTVTGQLPKELFQLLWQISIPFLSQTRYISGKYKVRVFLKLCVPNPALLNRFLAQSC